MHERRLQLGLRWKDVASQADITEQTLRQIRNGANEMRDLTRQGVERALGWQSGSVQAVMEGGEPELASSDSASAPSSGADEIHLVGPIEGLLEEGEELTGWTMALGGRQYRLAIPERGHAIEAVFGRDEGPEDVIADLRQQLESTLALAQTQAKRRGSRRA